MSAQRTVSPIVSQVLRETINEALIAQKYLLFRSRTKAESTTACTQLSRVAERVQWRTARRVYPHPLSQAEMRWPVNSPIMQNYSPRHCWNLPFRASRATIPTKRLSPRVSRREQGRFARTYYTPMITRPSPLPPLPHRHRLPVTRSSGQDFAGFAVSLYARGKL